MKALEQGLGNLKEKKKVFPAVFCCCDKYDQKQLGEGIGLIGLPSITKENQGRNLDRSLAAGTRADRA